MRKYEMIENEVQVGIREKESNDLIRIYPHKVKGDFNKISEQVLTWYYQQGCDKEDRILHYYVDVLDDLH